ncbi:cytoplasmic protein, partial [Salmonella enterica]|nr:cytoplasmic protein [Salmonella enterica]
MLLKNIVIGALMAIPALASANSLTETRERMAIEQQAIAYTVSQKWDKLDAM